MVLIRKQALADIIVQTLAGKEATLAQVDAALRTCTPRCDERCYRCPGINFDYTCDLVTLLFTHAYNSLAEQTHPEEYAARIAGAMQTFATPFSNSKNTLCYPHFLLHGIDRPTAQQVAEKIEDNARIIHETIASKEKYQTYRRIQLEHDLSLGNAGGDTDDYFSTCYFLARRNSWAGPSHGYIAKFSIFRDITNKTIIGLTVQGQTASTIRNKNGTEQKNKERGRAYARLTAQLGMDPRTYTILQVMSIAREQGFEHIKVIRTEAHPFAIEKHTGFLARYDNAVRAAGIAQEKECYLEAKL